MNNANAPAHPQLQVMTGPDGVEKVTFTSTPGLTKREAFAMAAMQGILANGTFVSNLTSTTRGTVIALSVDLADQLLAQLAMK